MDLRGLYKFTLVDYPGQIACIVFTAGCNFRCPYCHNAALVLDPHSQPRVTETEVFNFLAHRKKLLDGVVISGGEPTLQPDLYEFCEKIKNLGFKFKLDTNSSNPDIVFKIHENIGIDSLGVDFKSPAARYCELVSFDNPDISAIVHKVISYAIAHDIHVDIRTTVHKNLLSVKDLQNMYEELQQHGNVEWTLQQFNPTEVISPDLQQMETYSDTELIRIAESLGKNVRVRGLNGHILLDAVTE